MVVNNPLRAGFAYRAGHSWPTRPPAFGGFPMSRRPFMADPPRADGAEGNAFNQIASHPIHFLVLAVNEFRTGHGRSTLVWTLAQPEWSKTAKPRPC
jgi:hypothetical protein